MSVWKKIKLQEKPPKPTEKLWNYEMETMSREEIREIQAELIKLQVENAYNNTRFFRRRMDEAGVKPSDIKDLEDFSKKIPTFNKDEHLRPYQTPEDPWGGVLATEPWHITASTGTTGIPTFIGVTREDWKHILDQFARMAWQLGIREGDRAALLFYWFNAWTWLCDYACRELIGAATFKRDGYVFMIEEVYPMLKLIKPTTVWSGYSGILKITQIMRSKGEKFKDISPRLKSVSPPGDILTEAGKEVFERYWGAMCIDNGGTNDVLLATYACQDQSWGQHIAEDFFYVEVIDPVTKRPVKEKEGIGCWVVTPLRFKAMPYLRYMLDDYVQYTFEKCLCGSTHMRLRFLGRMGFTLNVNGKLVFTRSVENVLWRHPELELQNYRMVKQVKQPQDVAVIEITYDEKIAKNLATLKDEVESELEKALDVPVKLRFILPDEMKAIAHKFRKIETVESVEEYIREKKL